MYTQMSWEFPKKKKKGGGEKNPKPQPLRSWQPDNFAYVC